MNGIQRLVQDALNHIDEYSANKQQRQQQQFDAHRDYMRKVRENTPISELRGSYTHLAVPKPFARVFRNAQPCIGSKHVVEALYNNDIDYTVCYIGNLNVKQVNAMLVERFPYLSWELVVTSHSEVLGFTK